jgi:hypothetical protein
MPITEPLDPLKCYCGKATRIYDSLFKRNFCSDECSTSLRLFLGGTDRSIEIVNEVKAGDFRIRGPVVTLDSVGYTNPALARHQEAKATVIDKIDAQVQAQLDEAKERASLKKIGLPEAVIEAMLQAKRKKV